MEAKIETKEDLISGLNYVKTQIEKILSVTDKQVEIVANFRQEKQLISTSDKKSQIKLAAISLYIIFLFLNIILTIITHKPLNLIVALILGAIIYILEKKAKKGKKKIYRIILRYFEICCLFDIIAFIIASFASGSPILIILTLISIVASIFIVLKAIKKKNQKIEEDNLKTAEHNATVQKEYDETVEQLDILKKDLYNQSGNWYPHDYYSLEAVNFFLSAIENYKADTVKEMVLLFDDTQYKSEMLNSQRAIQSMSEQQLINQKEMIKQLRFANVMSVANIALQGATIGAINSQTSEINSAINSQISSVNTAIHNQTKDIGKAIGKASDKIINKLK